MTPKSLNQKAAKVMDKLTENLNDPGNHKTFDLHRYTEKWDGGIMAAHIECIGYLGHLLHYPLVYSVCHYFKQNGDMCQDPEMTFFKRDGKYYPVSFQMAIPPVYEESIWVEDEQIRFKPGLQRNHKDFANQWMLNIKEQQNL